MKTKCQNVIIDLDNYKKLEGDNDLPYNITITRSKKDPIQIPRFFLSFIKFNKLKFENVDNVVGIDGNFMFCAECVNKNKMKFYFPDLETIGTNFLDSFTFNNKITFKFPRLKKIDWSCGANINYFMKNTFYVQSELTIECDKLISTVPTSFYNARLNKLTIPYDFLHIINQEQNINKIKIYIPKRMISNEIII